MGLVKRIAKSFKDLEESPDSIKMAPRTRLFGIFLNTKFIEGSAGSNLREKRATENKPLCKISAIAILQSKGEKVR